MALGKCQWMMRRRPVTDLMDMLKDTKVAAADFKNVGEMKKYGLDLHVMGSHFSSSSSQLESKENTNKLSNEGGAEVAGRMWMWVNYVFFPQGVRFRAIFPARTLQNQRLARAPEFSWYGK
ncbi:hypothetical protein GOBAR_DD19795 [Gossypium barbadense]|nr:hypothetical protein GOBAR_DD19795 [Gossypium barbadense]